MYLLSGIYPRPLESLEIVLGIDILILTHEPENMNEACYYYGVFLTQNILILKTNSIKALNYAYKRKLI